MSFYDAHCHLQDERIAPFADDIVALCKSLGVQELVVNGTCEQEWDAVVELARRFDCVRPSFGLHPWKVKEASENWQSRLGELWDENPQSAVGEIGLDRWIEGYDLPRQEEAFLWQLEEARKRNLPVSIHCLRAWGKLDEVLRQQELPAGGFLLHSFGGPVEMVAPLARLGAYFSLSAYFAQARKEKQRAAFRAVPLDRLLIETDAPDMKGPDNVAPHRIASDPALNHPANIVYVYRFAAEYFEIGEAELRTIVAENYRRFFERG